ncbi:DHA2 family efflux MFS transporter permease subunit [Geomicrobium sediminis]|uniref:DHA2 family lincomycin resistance protein-like MFS transporter n=1 Tax=Geomicrobium sediminis TaxID=1347788 RepID=A0ABS2P747_9BACL|nr:DHA2 family efflux MFS transporter permease subunit [Geomicrobium sediminis]MBM7630976.1 DHA2 family lincomycin resistance protein-like MFS transporter [Geomicrobium sediminis]
MQAKTDNTRQQVNLNKGQRTGILIALIIGAFVAILNETLLANALNVLMGEFNVAATTVQWLTTAYMLVVGMLIPVTALLQKWWTTRQMFLTAMIVFLIGTLIAAVSPNFTLLLVGRIVQALGTGLILPLLMNTILLIYPPEKRGAAMGTMGLVIVLAPSLGPTLSGIILDYLSWQWLFYTMIPFGLIAIFIGNKFLVNVSVITKPKVDYLSILLSSIGFGGIVYGFSTSGAAGWGAPEVYGTIIVAIISLILFTIRSLRISNPILDLRTFKYPMFSLTVVLMIVVMMSLFASMTLLPLFMQSVLLVTAFTSGLMMLPGSLINGLLAPISGRLFDKFGPRVLIIPGLSLVVIAMYLFSGLQLDSTPFEIISTHMLLMVGISLVMMPAQTFGLNQLTSDLYGSGTAIMNTLQQVAGAVGTALFISVMSASATNYIETEVTDPSDPTQLLEGSLHGFETTFYRGISHIAIHKNEE